MERSYKGFQLIEVEKCGSHQVIIVGTGIRTFTHSNSIGAFGEAYRLIDAGFCKRRK